MNILAMTERLRGRGLDAKQQLQKYAKELADGGQVRIEEISKLCDQADIPEARFAAYLERLQARKEAVEAFEANNFDSEIEAAITAYQEGNRRLDAAKKEQDAIAEKVRGLHEETRSALSRRNNLQARKSEALDELAKAIREHGGGDDWSDLEIA